jgi:hypothetical protein
METIYVVKELPLRSYENATIAPSELNAIPVVSMSWAAIDGWKSGSNPRFGFWCFIGCWLGENMQNGFGRSSPSADQKERSIRSSGKGWNRKACCVD